jgi:hypothetical protein
LREDGSTVTIGLEVDTNVELLSGMVEVLYSGRRAGDRKTEVLLDILRGRAVCICSLYNTDFDLVSKA